MPVADAAVARACLNVTAYLADHDDLRGFGENQAGLKPKQPALALTQHEALILPLSRPVA